MALSDYNNPAIICKLLITPIVEHTLHTYNIYGLLRIIKSIWNIIKKGKVNS